MIALASFALLFDLNTYFFRSLSYPVGWDSSTYLLDLTRAQDFGPLVVLRSRSGYGLYTLIQFTLVSINLDPYTLQMLMPLIIASAIAPLLYGITYLVSGNWKVALLAGVASVFWFGRVRLIRDFHGTILALILIFSAVIISYFLLTSRISNRIGFLSLIVLFFLGFISHAYIFAIFSVPLVIALLHGRFLARGRFNRNGSPRETKTSLTLLTRAFLLALTFIAIYLILLFIFVGSPNSYQFKEFGSEFTFEVPGGFASVPFSWELIVTFGQSDTIDSPLQVLVFAVFLFGVAHTFVRYRESRERPGRRFLFLWLLGLLVTLLILAFYPVYVPLLGLAGPLTDFFQLSIGQYRFVILIPVPFFFAMGVWGLFKLAKLRWDTSANDGGKRRRAAWIASYLALSAVLMLSSYSIVLMGATSLDYIRRAPVWFDPSLQADLSSLEGWVRENPSDVPFVIVVNPEIFPAGSTIHQYRVWLTLKAAQVQIWSNIDFFFYLGDVANASLARPTLYDRPETDFVSRAVWAGLVELTSSSVQIVVLRSLYGDLGPGSEIVTLVRNGVYLGEEVMLRSY